MDFRPVRLVLLCIVVTLVSVLAMSTLGFAQFPAQDPGEACSRAHVKKSAQVKQYLFLSYKDEEKGMACIQILRDRKVIFRRTNENGGWFEIGQPADKDNGARMIPNGTDITGRGHPNMIVSAGTGGAHCCLLHYVFELEPEFKLLATIDGRDDDMAHFADLANDGRYYYVGADWTFAYWPGSFASSPSEAITLQFSDDKNGGGFHLALDKMYSLPPTAREWEHHLQEVNAALKEDALQSEELARPLWGTVLDLIYTGHSDLAWEFVKEVNPKAKQGSNPTLADFCSILKTSPYWRDLEPTIKDLPLECANAKPGRE